jgi:hypothetical protein
MWTIDIRYNALELIDNSIRRLIRIRSIANAVPAQLPNPAQYLIASCALSERGIAQHLPGHLALPRGALLHQVLAFCHYHPPHCGHIPGEGVSHQKTENLSLLHRKNTEVKN